MTTPVFISGAFDDLRSRQIRWLEQASKLGPVTVLLWKDELAWRRQGRATQFPEMERAYLLKSIRYVDRVRLVANLSSADGLPQPDDFEPGVWAVPADQDNPAKRAFCERRALRYHVLKDQEPQQPFSLPDLSLASATPGRKKVIVTGCYDWLHSGHVRFFEEVSAHGDLYVVLGHDANIRMLKGEGHPLFPQEERRYVVGSIRCVTQALIATGDGWLDAEPEIQKLKPDIYAVNDDGDKGGKREYCARHGIEYLVLKRTPAPGLPRRTSTDLRGF